MGRYADIQELNEARVKHPQEGDLWHEMFCPYFLVVAVDDRGVFVLYKTISLDSKSYMFDKSCIKYMKLQELRDAVTYPTMRDKFVANVSSRKS